MTLKLPEEMHENGGTPYDEIISIHNNLAFESLRKFTEICEDCREYKSVLNNPSYDGSFQKDYRELDRQLFKLFNIRPHDWGTKRNRLNDKKKNSPKIKKGPIKWKQWKCTKKKRKKTRNHSNHRKKYGKKKHNRRRR